MPPSRRGGAVRSRGYSSVSRRWTRSERSASTSATDGVPDSLAAAVSAAQSRPPTTSREAGQPGAAEGGRMVVRRHLGGGQAVRRLHEQ